MAPVQVPDPRPLPGEPSALDLLNTQWLASGTPVDLLATPDGTRTWLAAADVAGMPGHQTPQALIPARPAIRDVLTDHGRTAARPGLNTPPPPRAGACPAAGACPHAATRGGRPGRAACSDGGSQSPCPAGPGPGPDPPLPAPRLRAVV